MTDESLRNLQRSAADGDLPAQARVLHERVRKGELSGRQLRLAAYLRHPAAALAVEGVVLNAASPAVEPDSGYGRAVEACALRRRWAAFDDVLWFRGLSRWGLDVVARAGIAHLRGVAVRSQPADQQAVNEFFVALDRWCAAPSLEAYEEVEERGVRVELERAPLSFATAFVRLVQQPRQRERADVRRALLDVVETTVLWGDAEPAELGEVEAELLAWVFTAGARARLDDDRADALPEGPSLRQRVIEAQTPRTRLAAVTALLDGPGGESPKTVVDEDGKSFGVRGVMSVGLQTFSAFLGTGSPLISFSLDPVREVRPGFPEE